MANLARIELSGVALSTVGCYFLSRHNRLSEEQLRQERYGRKYSFMKLKALLPFSLRLGVGAAFALRASLKGTYALFRQRNEPPMNAPRLIVQVGVFAFDGVGNSSGHDRATSLPPAGPAVNGGDWCLIGTAEYTFRASFVLFLCPNERKTGERTGTERKEAGH